MSIAVDEVRHKKFMEAARNVCGDRKTATYGELTTGIANYLGDQMPEILDISRAEFKRLVNEAAVYCGIALTGSCC